MQNDSIFILNIKIKKLNLSGESWNNCKKNGSVLWARMIKIRHRQCASSTYEIVSFNDDFTGTMLLVAQRGLRKTHKSATLDCGFQIFGSVLMWHIRCWNFSLSVIGINKANSGFWFFVLLNYKCIAESFKYNFINA